MEVGVGIAVMTLGGVCIDLQQPRFRAASVVRGGYTMYGLFLLCSVEL